MLELLLAATLTVLATGLGTIPVFLLGSRAARLRPALLGIAAGVMAVAATAGMLAPALDDGSVPAVTSGLAAGIAFLLIARRLMERRYDAASNVVLVAHAKAKRTSTLVFAVLFVHSLPEGLALGSAYASTTQGLALFIFIAIAVQNIPEGTSVAIPMDAAGYSRSAQFWAATATSAPQPVGAAIAYVLTEQVDALLPLSFAFAAGAMLALVAVEVLPEAVRQRRRDALVGAFAGGATMFGLSLVLGV